ncbi:MAG: hypothetical protein LBK99_00445 [Opitutaceae bacterium]|jgi:hypothetical protein|nr:hypothetical protein [Opitutaceae bacterium]
MNISPDTLQPVPPGHVPALGAASGTLVILGVAAAQLQLYKPGAADPLAIVNDWQPDPAAGTYTAVLTLVQIDTIVASGPTLHASLNGGPQFHVRNTGEGDSIPSTGGSGSGGSGPGANYYTKEQTDQLLADIVRPSGGQYALEGPNGERAVFLRRLGDNKLIPVIGGGSDAAPSIDPGDPVAETQPE